MKNIFKKVLPCLITGSLTTLTAPLLSACGSGGTTIKINGDVNANILGKYTSWTVTKSAEKPQKDQDYTVKFTTKSFDDKYIHNVSSIASDVIVEAIYKTSSGTSAIPLYRSYKETEESENVYYIETTEDSIIVVVPKKTINYLYSYDTSGYHFYEKPTPVTLSFGIYNAPVTSDITWEQINTWITAGTLFNYLNVGDSKDITIDGSRVYVTLVSGPKEIGGVNTKAIFRFEDRVNPFEYYETWSKNESNNYLTSDLYQKIQNNESTIVSQIETETKLSIKEVKRQSIDTTSNNEIKSFNAKLFLPTLVNIVSENNISDSVKSKWDIYKKEAPEGELDYYSYFNLKRFSSGSNSTWTTTPDLSTNWASAFVCYNGCNNSSVTSSNEIKLHFCV